jgi:hypothetical protein
VTTANRIALPNKKNLGEPDITTTDATNRRLDHQDRVEG